MTLDSFVDALDTHGADLDLWPDDLGAEGRLLLATSAEAQAMHTAALRLDAQLAGMMAPVKAPSGLAGRIMSAAVPVSADVIPFPAPQAIEQPVLPPVAANGNRWIPGRASMIAAAAMVVCFLSGILTVQTVFPADPDGESVYVSAVYSDLAW